MPTLDKGYYWGKVKECGTAKTEKGTPYFYLTCDVVSLWVGEGYVDIPPEERTVFIYLSDAAMEYSAPKLAYIGFNGDFNDPDISEDAKVNGVRLENDPETYDGKLREKWQLQTRRSLEHTPLDKNEIRALNAKYKQAVPATKSATPTPAPRPKTNGIGETDLDDPPF